jgi:hypothetical protein
MRNLRSHWLFSHLAIVALKMLGLGASVLGIRCLGGSFNQVVERNHASVVAIRANKAALVEEDHAVTLLASGQLARVQRGCARAAPAFQKAAAAADRAIFEPGEAVALQEARREYEACAMHLQRMLHADRSLSPSRVSAVCLNPLEPAFTRVLRKVAVVLTINQEAMYKSAAQAKIS